MTITVIVDSRPVPLPGEGPTERHVEGWRVLRFEVGDVSWDQLVGHKLGLTTVTNSSPIMRCDAVLPRIETQSGRHYVLHGPPVDPCSQALTLYIALLAGEAKAMGSTGMVDVSTEYWSRWLTSANPS